MTNQTSPLRQSQLLDVLLQAVDRSGWRALTLAARKPFRLRIYTPEERGFDVLAYIWNCTHGGGAA